MAGYIIYFRHKRDKEDMIHKAKKMKEFAEEFVDCLERSEDEYYEDERYNERDRYDERDDRELYDKPHMRGGAKMRGRYGY